MKSWVARLGGGLESRVLAGLLAAAASLWIFIKIASEVAEGDTHAVDAAIVLWLRNPNDAASPLGPPWLVDAARDITALGSFAVLALFVIAAAIFLAIARHPRTAVLVCVSSSAGAVLTFALKSWFDRPRPEFVVRDVYGSAASFPSGHATMSALVYLTLAALIVRVVRDRRLKVTALAVAALLTGLVGVTRVYLGFHWPSDVLAGWALGAAWALGFWTLAQLGRRFNE